MEVNVGLVDRVVRITAGAVLVGLAATSVIGPWGYIGMLPLITGAIRFCPAYRLFGFRTNSPQG
jgi:hypothetical protein